MSLPFGMESLTRAHLSLLLSHFETSILCDTVAPLGVVTEEVKTTYRPQSPQGRCGNASAETVRQASRYQPEPQWPNRNWVLVFKSRKGPACLFVVTCDLSTVLPLGRKRPAHLTSLVSRQQHF